MRNYEDLVAALNFAVNNKRKRVASETRSLVHQLERLTGRLKSGHASMSDVRNVMTSCSFLLEQMAGLDALNEWETKSD